MRFLIIVNIAVLLLLMFGLFMMQKKHVSFSKRVFTALGLGIIFGFIIHLIYGTTHEVTTGSIDWFNIVGKAMLNYYKWWLCRLYLYRLSEHLRN